MAHPPSLPSLMIPSLSSIKDLLSCTVAGVTSHGYSCVVCKCKVHKRCSTKAISNCKWTTLASIGKDIIEDKDGVSITRFE